MAKSFGLFGRLSSSSKHLSTIFPIIQAPMSPITSPRLVGSVCNNNGIGTIAAARMNSKQIKDEIKAVRKITSNPFAINLFVPPTERLTSTIQQQNIVRERLLKIQEEIPSHVQLPPTPLDISPLIQDFNAQVTAIIDEKVPFFTFTFGIPSPKILEDCNKAGITTIGTATTVAEALALYQAGVDAICIQSTEAGGHRGTFLTPDNLTIQLSQYSLFTLLPNIRSLVGETYPLIAAGGIMNGEGIAFAKRLGADAVQMGTAFMTVEESNLIPPSHKALLLTPSLLRSQGHTPESIIKRIRPTTLTRVFSGKPARGIYNKMIESFNDLSESLLPWQEQAALVQPVARDCASKGEIEYMQLWAGQGYELCEGGNVEKLMFRLRKEMNRYT